ncbi:uncharacterized protein G2W53_004450 [Senna tora]|uniref:Uncharacterized protein n=1 Tax=Senna tora TaxID=362788 RepID=A0A834XD68_9FABA|nr:uncharacterized protein G2W53_004450 [Senna tora]
MVIKRKQDGASSKMKQIAASSKGKGKDKVTVESTEEQMKRKNLELLDVTDEDEIEDDYNWDDTNNSNITKSIYFNDAVRALASRPQLPITQPMVPTTVVRPPPLRPASMYI